MRARVNSAIQGMGVSEADLDSDKDALTIERETGAKVIRIHTC